MSSNLNSSDEEFFLYFSPQDVRSGMVESGIWAA